MVRKSLTNMMILVFAVGAATLLGGCEHVQLNWKYPSDSACYSSPALTDDFVVFGTESGEVHAVTKKNGAIDGNSGSARDFRSRHLR